MPAVLAVLGLGLLWALSQLRSAAASDAVTADEWSGFLMTDATKSAGSKVTADSLAAAIKHVETGGNYNAKGASGEFGAYQFLPASWSAWAEKYLGSGLAPMTPANQDAVAKARLQELLDRGYTPRQVALIWNGGVPIEKQGINKFRVAYNSGSYADKVVAALNSILG